MKPAAIIYLVTNTVNGKRYVGLSRHGVKPRWTQHVYNAKTGLKTYLYSAMRKHGAENFHVSEIASCLNVNDASEVERAVIATFQPEYNQTNGGEFTAGKRVPREVVERIIAKNRGLKRTPEHNRRMSELKTRQYAERPDLKAGAIARIRAARAFVDENKRKAAAARACRERVWSIESRSKLSASCTGRRLPQDAIDRMAATKRKPIQCPTLYNLTFKSCEEAAEALGISGSSVYKVCAGARDSVSGLCFAYI